MSTKSKIETKSITGFERYLTVWVALPLVTGFLSRKWIIVSKGKDVVNSFNQELLARIQIIERDKSTVQKKKKRRKKNQDPQSSNQSELSLDGKVPKKPPNKGELLVDVVKERKVLAFSV